MERGKANGTNYILDRGTNNRLANPKRVADSDNRPEKTLNSAGETKGLRLRSTDKIIDVAFPRISSKGEFSIDATAILNHRSGDTAEKYGIKIMRSRLHGRIEAIEVPKNANQHHQRERIQPRVILHHQTALIQLQSYLELYKVASNAKPHCHASANQLQGSLWMVELAAINSKLSVKFEIAYKLILNRYQS
ncbi:hypothetical protein TSAR_001163 [Trichomalopsis sarcophagae]|uniref:Uncharacterized protein n=1 Tax=Trichomalopsis sarcophagae TaxID=543379 RepID=A0A232EPU1_9HYME|nr:hypothetical protein TSAR_001163 [Trichomalopsis sarcophagae]